jgi:hypothetical protein
MLTAARSGLPGNPFPSFALFDLMKGPHFGMQKQPHGAYDPILPFMSNDNGYALYFLVVIFYEADVFLEGSDILPAAKIRGVNQQSYVALLLEEGVDLRCKLPKVPCLQLFGYGDFQHTISDQLCLDHCRFSLAAMATPGASNRDVSWSAIIDVNQRITAAMARC